MMKTFLIAALGAVLCGCSAVPTASVGSTSLMSQDGAVHAPAQPKIVSAERVRKVLAASGSALWGIQYDLTYQYGKVFYSRMEQTGSGRLVKEWYSYYLNNFMGTANFSGKGELIKASHDRFVYQVPEGQVLVLNTLKGKGSAFVNGYGMSVDHATLPIQYLFGPGELVTIKFAPGLKSHDRDKDGNTKVSRVTTETFYPMDISGFTADPSLFAGLGMVAGK